MLSTTHKTTLLFLCSLVIIVNSIDVLLSYTFFLQNPSTFIANEINQEAVQFFTTGSIPYLFILNILLHLLTIIIFLQWHHYIKNYKKQATSTNYIDPIITSSKYLFIGSIMLYCFTRITGAMTWYDTNSYLFYNLTLLLHPLVIVLLLISCTSMILTYTHITINANKTTTKL